MANTITLVHLGPIEKSGEQILTKLNQYKFDVEELVINEANDFSLLENITPETLVINIGNCNYDYDELFQIFFDKCDKVIINEACDSNDLVGLKRRSWERHLLNKIDSSIEIIPTQEPDSDFSRVDLKDSGINQVWVLAASIGGPEALNEFFTHLEKTDNLYIVLQHMDKSFLPSFTKQLKAKANIKIIQPMSGTQLEPMAVIYPTDENIKFTSNGDIELRAQTKEHSFTPCIDDCVELLLKDFENVNMAVFSGMCEDGVEAAKIIKTNNGKIIVQSEETCVLPSIISGVKKVIDIEYEGSPKNLAQYINK